MKFVFFLKMAQKPIRIYYKRHTYTHNKQVLLSDSRRHFYRIQLTVKIINNSKLNIINGIQI